jgi:hypothetical protein
MRTLSADTLAALSAPTVGLATLVLMEFPTATIALNTTNMTLVWDGVEYLGAAGLGTISQIDDSPGETKGLSLEIAGVRPEAISLALDDAAVVQGTPLTIRTAIINAAGVIVDAPIDWVGRLDTMSIEDKGDSCAIQVTAESSAVDLLRGSPLTYSDSDQQSLAPGDSFFDQVVPQAGQPVVWPSKSWQPAPRQLGQT